MKRETRQHVTVRIAPDLVRLVEKEQNKLERRTGNRSGGTTVYSNDQYHISVKAEPGMNEDALARKVIQQLRQQQAVRQRSMMIDGAQTP